MFYRSCKTYMPAYRAACCFGDPDAPAVVLLHDAPGSGLGLEATARDVAASGRRVIVPDLPGCGESDDPAGAVLDAGAAAIAGIADALQIGRYAVAAIGCGVAVAAKIDDPRLPREAWAFDSVAALAAPRVPVHRADPASHFTHQGDSACPN